MSFKQSFLSILLTSACISLNAAQQEDKQENKTKFTFKNFNNKKECKGFIRNHNLWFFHPVVGLSYVSNFSKEQATEHGIYDIPENFREKCNEAIEFFLQGNLIKDTRVSKQISEDSFANEWRTLFITINEEKVAEPEKYKDAYLINPDSATLLTALGANPLNVFNDVQYKELVGLNFEQALDKLHTLFECHKEENNSSQDCIDIEMAKSGIKALTKLKELQRQKEDTSAV